MERAGSRKVVRQLMIIGLTYVRACTNLYSRRVGPCNDRHSLLKEVAIYHNFP